jgi:hypothetical protein
VFPVISIPVTSLFTFALLTVACCTLLPFHYLIATHSLSASVFQSTASGDRTAIGARVVAEEKTQDVEEASATTAEDAGDKTASDDDGTKGAADSGSDTETHT